MPASRLPGESMHREIGRASTAFSSGPVCLSSDDGSLSKRDATEAKSADNRHPAISPDQRLREMGDGKRTGQLEDGADK